MKKLFSIILILFSVIVQAQNLKTTVDNSLLNQGTRGITALKLRNTLNTIVDSLRLTQTNLNSKLSSSIAVSTYAKINTPTIGYFENVNPINPGFYSGYDYVYSTGNDIFGKQLYKYRAGSGFLGAGLDGINQNIIPESSTIDKLLQTQINSKLEISAAVNYATQTDLNSKLSLSGGTMTGTLTAPNISNTLGANFATNSGNVGIGTTPAYKLHVSGGNIYVGGVGSGLRLEDRSLSTRSFQLYVDGGALAIFNHNNSTQPFTINNAGNVGLGTTTPVAKLTVVGSDNAISIDAGAGGNPYLDFHQATFQKAYLQYVNTGAYMRLVDAGIVGLVQKNGQIGIGTIAPATKFHIEGTGYVSALIRSTTTTAGGLITLSNSTNSYSLGARGDYGTGQFNLVDETAGVLRLSITQAGNLLVGTSLSDLYKLNVAGTAQATQFKLSALNTAPANATAAGTVGEIRVDASFIYICTATNVWKRSAITSW